MAYVWAAAVTVKETLPVPRTGAPAGVPKTCPSMASSPAEPARAASVQSPPAVTSLTWTRSVATTRRFVVTNSAVVAASFVSEVVIASVTVAVLGSTALGMALGAAVGAAVAVLGTAVGDCDGARLGP